MKKAQDDNQKLLNHIEGGMKLIHQGLEILYQQSDEIRADLIHGLRKNLFHISGILFDLLFDGTPAGKILEDRK